ncbi:MAG: hypothetical protein SOV16_00455 [Anaerobiospirillum succiniciproducens]|uniref:hypothetical protein n=1 Tax=Anaerobiospirillum succiniciproducens TaxID=13335 RepID=UPI002A759D6C|nr:hypothetical protein [Anaerobiospirillum succiniciproducens]MDY2797652.1 hypothetical protein [Anaerobiospirillum succiniciproducens]
MAKSSKENTNSESNKGKQRYFVEERMFGRGFSGEQSMELTFAEFLAFYFGIKEVDGFRSRFDYALSRLEKGEQFSSYIPSAHLLRRILYDNANLNARFIEDHSDVNLWELWQNYYIDIHGYCSDDELKNKFKSYVASLKSSFYNQDDQNNENISFRRFYAVVDILRSNTLEYSSDKRWSSKFLFPFSSGCLFYDADIANEEKGPAQETLNLDTRFYRGQGHTLIAMLALSSSSDIKEQISQKLSDLFEHNTSIFAKAVECISGDAFLESTASSIAEGGDNKVNTVLTESRGNKTMLFFPYSVRESCQDLFDSLAEDFINVLNLQISLSKKVRTLTILSSLYIYTYLLRRCFWAIKQVQSKFPEPFIPLLLGNCDLKYFSRDVYHKYSENIISRAVKCAVIYGLEKAAETKKLSCLQQYIDNPKNKFLNPKDQKELFKDALRPVLYSDNTKENEEDLNKLVDKCESFEEILRNCTDALKKRRRISSIVTDSMLSKMAMSIGLVTRGSSNFYHYAITDELLEVLVLACCKERYIQNSEFLDKLFKRFRIAISTKSFEDLIKSGSQDQNVDMNKVKQNEQLLQSRLEKMGLCKALSDASFYYVFNPYVASN